MTDWGDLYRENVAAVSALAPTLTEEQLATTVPGTPAWTVHEVLAHLAGVASDAVTGRMDGAPSPEWTSRHVNERAALPVAELVAELQSHQDAIAESVVDNPRPAMVWNLAVHHADLHEALGLPGCPSGSGCRSPRRSRHGPRRWPARCRRTSCSAGSSRDGPAHRCRRGVPACRPRSSTTCASSAPGRTTSPYRTEEDEDAMASYAVNKAAVARCRELISGKQYVLDSDWGDAQPDAAAGTAYLDRHSWDEYAAWHLGLTEGANDETKARYAFVYGDLRRVHRTGLIACVYRASEWRHKAVELAAHDLLQELDRAAGIS